MSIEFGSNPLATKLDTFNLKVQFNAFHFYDLTPVITCSDPYITITGYDTLEHSFTFEFTISPQNAFSLGGMLLSGFVANAPIVAGAPAIVPNEDVGMWWAIMGVSADGRKATYKIGAEKNLVGIGKLPHIIFMHLIVNADIRSMQP